MSNEFVQASVNFLTESWYKENAGTLQYREAKYIKEVFDDIVEFCLENGLEIEEAISIASEIIEEDIVEEFYEEYLGERRNIPADVRNKWNTTRVQTGNQPKINTARLNPNQLLHRSSPTGAKLPMNAPSPGMSGVGAGLARLGVVGAGAAALLGGPLARPTVSGKQEAEAIRAAEAAKRRNQNNNNQTRPQPTRPSRPTSIQPTRPSRPAPTQSSSSAPRMPSISRPTPERPAAPQGPLTVGGQGVATNTGSLPREPQAPFDRTRPIIRSIFNDKNK